MVFREFNLLTALRIKTPQIADVHKIVVSVVVIFFIVPFVDNIECVTASATANPSDIKPIYKEIGTIQRK